MINKSMAMQGNKNANKIYKIEKTSLCVEVHEQEFSWMSSGGD